MTNLIKKTRIMTIFIKKLLSIALVGIFSLSFSQKTDPKAKTMLDAVSNNYKAKNNVYFKFVYAMGNKKQTGIFYASKNKYKFKVMGNEQIFDGNKIYNINGDEQEITITKSNSNDSLLSPISYLDAYKKNHNVAYAGKNIIKLTPTKTNGIKQILIHINSAKKQVEKIEQHADDKSITSITIVDYKENLKLNPSLFSFNKNLYKNYLITEL